MKKWLVVFSWFIIALGISEIASAHPGRTDASGCHTCRTNCPKWGLNTGEYHCHNAKALPQPEEPIKSHYSETGGYTEPAPEYKVPKQESIKFVQPAAVEVKQEINVKEKAIEKIIQDTEENTTADAVVGISAVSGIGYGVYRLFRSLKE